MAGLIEGIDRGQTLHFPDQLEDWIDEDHFVCVVDLFVDELELSGLGFVRSAAARTGRPVPPLSSHWFRNGMRPAGQNDCGRKEVVVMWNRKSATAVASAVGCSS
jgi:hypothetical protein